MNTQHWSSKSPICYQSLECLSKATFALIWKCISSGEPIPEIEIHEVSLQDSGTAFGTHKTAVPSLPQMVVNKTKEIKALPEFAGCVESIVAENKAFLPSDKDASKFVSDMYVFPFLVRLMPWPQTEPVKFDRSGFDSLYQEIEKSIYSDVYEFRAWSYLRNFELPINTLFLASNLRMRRFSRSEQEHRLQQALALWPPPSDFETTFEVLKNPDRSGNGVYHP